MPGIVAEMIKAGGDELEAALLNLFNDISDPQAMPPEKWRKNVIKVLHKSGDVKLPQNYRPIAIVPLMYKLYSRLLFRINIRTTTVC